MATAESWREFFSFLTVPPDQSLIRLTIYYTEPIALLESDCHGFRATILEQIPGIDARLVIRNELTDRTVEPAANYGLRHVMSTFRDPLLDPGQRHLNPIDEQEEKVDFVTCSPKPLNQSQIASAR